MKKKEYVLFSLISIVYVVTVTASILFLIMAVNNRNNNTANTIRISYNENIAELPPQSDIIESEIHLEPFHTEITEPQQDEHVVSVPDALDKVLTTFGYSSETLNDLGCMQLITVESSGTEASINFYTFDNEEWCENEALSCSGFVGYSGVSNEKREGDGSTPAGLFSVGDAFFINEEPKTGLDTFEITEDTYWVDDPDSIFYNMRIEGTVNQDWNSAEHMIDYSDVYEYGFVINYNIDGEYNAGSAIFFHICNHPTFGCVGTDREFVLGYLSELNAEMNPHIIII